MAEDEVKVEAPAPTKPAAVKKPVAKKPAAVKKPSAPKAKKVKQVVDLEEFLVGGNLTAEAREAGLTDDDVAGGSFVDPEHAHKLLDK